jgi:hypothetical protein
MRYCIAAPTRSLPVAAQFGVNAQPGNLRAPYPYSNVGGIEQTGRVIWRST